MPSRRRDQTDHSLVVLDRFIPSARSSGYRGTSSAVAELVDNALQAWARSIAIWVEDSGAGVHPITITVSDDGCGMKQGTLWEALRFGGSSRFGDRSGLGCYGLGLPNSSLSQARRVDVYSWMNGGRPVWSYLDLDEIVGCNQFEVPRPSRRCLPRELQQSSSSGTVVRWSRCDRLARKQPASLVRDLEVFLGRVFRYFLWNGVKIELNGKPVTAYDPLCVHTASAVAGAHRFGEPLRYEVRTGETTAELGIVEVVFSELPIADLHELPSAEKRRLGISRGAGMSVIRADREVDYGWFLFGKKRRENYDDWWRCELRFEPILDDAFGISNTKQQIRPKDFLVDILESDLEATARILNRRVREAHKQLKPTKRLPAAVTRATRRDSSLPTPVSRAVRSRKYSPVARRVSVHQRGSLREAKLRYVINQEQTEGRDFCTSSLEGRSLVLTLNVDHPFYTKLYQPLAELGGKKGDDLRMALDLLLLASSRAQISVESARDSCVIEEFRETWANYFAVFAQQ